MSLILLPNGRGTTREYPQEFEPGYQPKEPICQVCGCETHYPDNPIIVKLRPSWNHLDKNPRTGLDARCARCREKRGA